MDNKNNSLVALVFDDAYKAEEARAALHRMSGEGLLEINETAIIVKNGEGKIHVSQDVNEVQKEQKIGHIAGLVTAAVTGTFPFIIAGTVAGNLIGKLRENGVTNKFLKSLQTELQPNTSILVIYGRSDPERRVQVANRLAIFDPKLIESDLPPDLERQITEEIRVARKAATG